MGGEWFVGVLCSLCRRVPAACTASHSGTWQQRKSIHATHCSRSPSRLSRPVRSRLKITRVAGLRFTTPLHNSSFKPTPLRGVVVTSSHPSVPTSATLPQRRGLIQALGATNQHRQIDMTEHWGTLVSIIIGLGIADLLVNLHRLIHARKQVQWDALPLVWASIAFLWLFNYWWAVGVGLDGSRDARVVGHYVLLAILPILLFLMSASVLPRAIPESGQLNMQAEWSKSRDIFLTILVINQIATWIVVSIARGAIVADLAGLVRTIVLLCALGALFFRSRRFEWLAATIVIIVAVARISSQAIR